MPEMLQLQRFAEPEPVRRYAPETPDQLNRLIQQLLAKDPNDRFPNVMVLGRHMEAMEKALSRPLQPPTAHAQTEAEDTPPRSAAHQATAEFRDQRTRAQPVPFDTKSEPVPTDIHEAATVAQPSDAALELEPVPPLRSTFTTIDEDKRRQQEAASESHWLLWAQLAALAAVLAALVWGGWRLARPYTADELYALIESTLDQEGEAGLRGLEHHLDDFAQRFPDDPRNAKLNKARQQLEFQKFQRQAENQARRGGENGDSPVGTLYLQAARRAESEPTQALVMLQSLVTLYDPTGTTAQLDPTGELTTDQRWLVLARRKLAELDASLKAQAQSQLPALNRQLNLAMQITTTNPDLAERMFQAIIRLYGDQPWAADVVAAARQRLAAMHDESTE
jgi:hypothetical protein